MSDRQQLKSDIGLTIKILANARKSSHLSDGERVRSVTLASFTRKRYNELFFPSGPKKVVHTVKPTRIDSGVVEELLAENPQAGWKELSILAKQKGHDWQPSSIRYHVLKVL